MCIPLRLWEYVGSSVRVMPIVLAHSWKDATLFIVAFRIVPKQSFAQYPPHVTSLKVQYFLLLAINKNTTKWLIVKKWLPHPIYAEDSVPCRMFFTLFIPIICKIINPRRPLESRAPNWCPSISLIVTLKWKLTKINEKVLKILSITSFISMDTCSKWSPFQYLTLDSLKIVNEKLNF